MIYASIKDFAKLFLILLLGWQTAPASAQAPDISEIPLYSREQLGYEPQDFSCKLNPGSEQLAAFLAAMKARALLRNYDESLELYRSNPAKYWTLSLDFNEMRGDIFYNAISAYNWVGPIDFPEDSAELLRLFSERKNEKPYLQNPADLNELVRIGIIPHLPESPYPNEAWVDVIPSYPVQPGTVFYKSYPTRGERGVLHEQPGLLENYVLFVFDQVQYGYDPEYLQDAFPGDEGGLLEALGQPAPEGVIYAHGIYQNWHPKEPR